MARLVLLLAQSATAALATTGCKYGTKQYWDGMYAGTGEAVTADGLSAERHAWYCGWPELEPFWSELVPAKSARVLVPGVGNDPTVCGLYDAGWTDIAAFDYAPAAIERLELLLEGRSVRSICADASDLPFNDAAFDAVLDKGALDAIGIAGDEALFKAVAELARTVAPGGVVVCVSRALEASVLLDAFSDSRLWGDAPLRDGGLHLCESGEASNDLAAGLFAWRRQ